MTLLVSFWISCKDCVDESGRLFSAILPDQQEILRMLEEASKARKALESRQHCFHAAQTGKHLLRTQILCSQQMLRARANGETFVSATMCPRLPGP